MCPICKKGMVQQDFSSVIINVCRDGCKVMWFDYREHGALEAPSQVNLEILEEKPSIAHWQTIRTVEDSCCGIPMHRHLHT